MRRWTEIRKIPGLEFLPIIAVTASNLLSEDNSLKERFSGFVRKPFSKRELFDELADFLPRHSKTEPSTKTSDSGQTESESGGSCAGAERTHFPIAPVARLSRGRPSATAWPSMKAKYSRRDSKAWGNAGNANRWSITRKNCSATRKIMP